MVLIQLKSENEKEYNIWFRDDDNDVSYKSYPKEDYEYLKTTRFNSPLCV